MEASTICREVIAPAACCLPGRGASAWASNMLATKGALCRGRACPAARYLLKRSGRLASSRTMASVVHRVAPGRYQWNVVTEDWRSTRAAMRSFGACISIAGVGDAGGSAEERSSPHGHVKRVRGGANPGTPRACLIAELLAYTLHFTAGRWSWNSLALRWIMKHAIIGSSAARAGG